MVLPNGLCLLAGRLLVCISFGSAAKLLIQWVEIGETNMPGIKRKFYNVKLKFNFNRIEKYIIVVLLEPKWLINK